MPTPGIIGRIAAQSMMGADAEEISRAVENLMAEAEEQTIAMKEREHRPKIYIPKDKFKKLDPTIICALEEECRCVIIPADDDEIQHLEDNAIPYTMKPELPDIKMLTPPLYDLPHTKGGRYHEPPRDLKKKKKSKRRQQKQSRRRHK